MKNHPLPRASLLPLMSVIVAAGLCCMALTGCIVINQSPDAPQQSRTSSSSTPNNPPVAAPDQSNSSDAGLVTSTALVVYANDDQVAFVDQETGTLYIPMLPDDGVFDANGREIDDDDLVVGNIVSVTGNGAMAESYPGQYPGITRVQVLEQGDPAAAQQYADELSTIFKPVDPSEVATASVTYTDSQATVSLPLTAYSYDWESPTGMSELDGDYENADGSLRADIPDARIAKPVEATVVFSTQATSVDVERTPIAKNAQGSWAIDIAAHDENVRAASQNDGVVFTIEPGYVYEIDAEFGEDRDASFAFIAVS